jgi:hypothetical protein
MRCLPHSTAHGIAVAGKQSNREVLQNFRTKNSALSLPEDDWQVEIIIVVLMFKILYPSNVSMNRGNHEALDLNRIYGFGQEVSLAPCPSHSRQRTLCLVTGRMGMMRR